MEAKLDDDKKLIMYVIKRDRLRTLVLLLFLAEQTKLPCATSEALFYQNTIPPKRQNNEKEVI